MVLGKKSCLDLFIFLVCVSISQANLFGHDTLPGRNLYEFPTGIESDLLKAKAEREKAQRLIAAQAAVLAEAAQATRDLETALQGLRAEVKKFTDKGLEIEGFFDFTDFERQQEKTAIDYARLAASIEQSKEKQEDATDIKHAKSPAGTLKRPRKESSDKEFCAAKPQQPPSLKKPCTPLVPLFAEGKLGASDPVCGGSCAQAGDVFACKTGGYVDLDELEKQHLRANKQTPPVPVVSDGKLGVSALAGGRSGEGLCWDFGENYEIEVPGRSATS